MLKNYKTKEIIPSDEILEEFFFPGGGEYEPLAIRAGSREEAEKIWLEKRIKVESSQIIN